MEEKGLEGFTLRECARRAGVSHQAPAHHFGDATGLLTELAAIGFEELDSLMTRYREEGSADPYSQFIATGLAYFDYALSHRARFQLMFRSAELNFENARLLNAASRTYLQLEETLRELSATIGKASLSLDERAALAWSLVHGFAALMLDNEAFAENVGGSPKKARAVLLRMLLASRRLFET